MTISSNEIIYKLSGAIIGMLEHYTDSDKTLYTDGLSCNEQAIGALIQAGIVKVKMDKGVYYEVNSDKLEYTGKKQEETEKESAEEEITIGVDIGKQKSDKTIYSIRQGKKIIYFGEEKPKSIWKDVSELPDRNCNVYVRWIDGDVLPAEFFTAINIFRMTNTGIEMLANDSRIEKYCLLTDFVNYIENLEKRIAKLEEK